MSVKIKLKHSSVKDKAPLPADLTDGELALNVNVDSPAAYLKDSAGNIVKLAGAGAIGGTPATESAAGIVELATAAETTTGTDNTRAVHPAGLKVELDKKAPLASPALTGVPTAPTAAAGTSTTQLATTAFVAAAVSAEDLWDRTGTAISPHTAGDTVQISAGTEALPGLTPVGDPNTGVFSPGADQLALSTNGARRLLINSTGELTLDTGDATIYGVRVGRGAGAQASNTVVGAGGALASNSTGGNNVALGEKCLAANTSGNSNIAIGSRCLNSNLTGGNNIALGVLTLSSNTSGTSNIGLGYQALASSTGNSNIAIGFQSGINLTTGSNNTIIGSIAGTAGLSNTVIIGAGGTERLRSTSDGYLRLASGTKGIQFNGDTAADNALDDYEEGTWTPALNFGGAATGITYATQKGTYTKVGNVVRFVVDILLSSKGSSTGIATISGLPFSISNTNGNSVATGMSTITTDAKGNLLMILASGSTSQLRGQNSNSSYTDAAFGASTVIRITGTYQVS